MIRDRFAGAHTPQTAMGKSLDRRQLPHSYHRSHRADATGQHLLRHPRPAGCGDVGGGMIIESHGALVGASGVSGAPTGADDDRCAKAGIDAIHDALVF